MPPPPPPPFPTHLNDSEDGLLISQLEVLDEPDRPNPFDLITVSRR